MRKPLEGIEFLRYAVRLFDSCKESFMEKAHADDLLKIAKAHHASEYDYYPDLWSQRQVDECLEHGKVPRWDRNEKPIYE